MSDADVFSFYTACLGDLVCKHLYDQEILPNSTRFDIIARTRIAAWPVSFSAVATQISNHDTLRAMYLVSHAASNECGFNQWAPEGKCVYIAPFERPSAVFVNVVFVVFIVIIVIAGAVFFALKLTPAEEEEDEQTSRAVVPGKPPGKKPRPIPLPVPSTTASGGGANGYQENDMVLFIVRGGTFQPLRVLKSDEAENQNSTNLPNSKMQQKVHMTVDSMLVGSHGIEYASGIGRRRWH